jgi:hypothetical protein
MKKLFIDANIYLEFYDFNKPDLSKILNSLLELKDFIFINQQLVDEVRRNKLKVAQRSFIFYLSNTTVKPFELPISIDGNELEDEGFNQEIRYLYEKQQELTSKLNEMFHEILNNIMRSQDQASQVLEQLFTNAVAATEEELSSARIRKELGNPPGKKDDPLGDQLTWEQFLSCSLNTTQIWIITKDRDYIINFDNKNYFNSFLYQELIGRNSKLTVFCFNSLAEGLKHFSQFSKEKIHSLPPIEVLDAISQAESFPKKDLPGEGLR